MGISALLIGNAMQWIADSTATQNRVKLGLAQFRPDR
jgi:hypothetical protein